MTPGKPINSITGITVREVDGTPIGTCVTLVFPNGSVGIADGVATITIVSFDGVYSSLTGIPSTFAPSAHNHAASEITSGTLPVVRGGTGLTALGSSLQVLRTNAAGTANEYATITAGDALTSNPLSQFAATTSAQLAGVISDETGSGLLVFATSPTLTTPNIGVATGTSIKLGNATNGPTITTSGASPNESMVFTPGGGSGAQFVKNGVAPLSGNGVPQGEIATFRGAANKNWRIFTSSTGIITDTLNDSITGYSSWGLNAIDIDLNSAGGGKVKIGGGTGISKVLSATATLDFPSIASNDTHSLTMTVTGAIAGNAVFIGVPAALDANLIWQASVTAADTVTIRMHNASGASVDPASGTYRATVFQF